MRIAPLAVLAGLTASAAVVLSIALVMGDPAAAPNIGSFVPAATASPGPVTTADPDPTPSVPPPPVASAPTGGASPAPGAGAGPAGPDRGRPQPIGPGSAGATADPTERHEAEASPTPSRDLPDD